jgi:carbon storage regulator
MLVLARKKGERIWIGESILLTVVTVRNGQVRLAFEAPDSVAIDREEVRNRRQEFLPVAQQTTADRDRRASAEKASKSEGNKARR